MPDFNVCLPAEGNVWVNASAGCGKTKSLIDRLVRLLLSDVSPEHILCITYTKAAAGEIEHRLMKTLEGFLSQSLAEIAQTLQAILLTEPRPQHIQKAQSLFYKVLEAPLQIHTIHSFCQYLLKCFSLEAGLNVGFKVADEQESQRFIEQAYGDVFAHLSEDCLKNIEVLVKGKGDERLRDLLQHLFQERSHLFHLWNHYGHLDVYGDFLKKTFLSHIYRAPDQVIVQKLINILQLDDNACDESIGRDLDIYLQRGQLSSAIWLTQAGEPRKKLFPKSFLIKYPDMASCIEAIAQHAKELQDLQKNTLLIEQTLAILSLFEPLLKRYEELKAAHNVVDFDDLLIKVNTLLDDPDLSAWVFQKLDYKIEHLLIDEAQDTSPDQWRIIIQLIHELMTPDHPHKTLYVVGDMKQSIYSFQGAKPQLFKDLEPHFQRHFQDQQRSWQYKNLHHSYRTTPAVLEVVDLVFEKHHTGVRYNLETLKHSGNREKQPGKVELWPLIKISEPEKSREFLPIQRIPYISVYKELAMYCAQKIDEIVRSHEVLPSTKKTPQAQDILVLVQKRNALIPFLIQELSKLGIKTSGRDQIALHEHLLIQDLYAIACFLSLPDDDYNLACILKGPFVNQGHGISEELLWILCHKRSGTLWQSLIDQSHTDKNIESIYIFLKNLLEQVDYCSPFEIFYRVTLQKREDLYARFGKECDDVLEAFLDTVLQFENLHPPTMQGFISFFTTNEWTIKKNLSSEPQGVRIMTVHGSKGLQAPIVMIADASEPPTIRQDLSFWCEDPLMWLLKPSLQETTPQLQPFRENAYFAALEEHRRLLYVAMTRAQDHLYIGGIERRDMKDSWYEILHDTLKDITEGSSEKGYCYDPIDNTTFFKEEHEKFSSPLPLPSWLLHPVITTKQVHKVKDGLYDDMLALRGIQIHKLFELTQGCSLKEAKIVARKILNQRQIMSQEMSHILRVFEYADLEIFFTKEALCEVEILVENQLMRLDRLVISSKEVLILDIKTSLYPPASAKDVCKEIQQQMQRYARTLQKMYPHHHIRTFLLWTETPHLMEIACMQHERR